MGDPEETAAGGSTNNGWDNGTTNPPVVQAGAVEVGSALARGAVVAVPAVGGYALVVQVGTNDAEARLEALAADPEGPHYAVGHRNDVRGLTSGWSDEVERLLERCWPGPLDVFLPRASAGEGEPPAAGGTDAPATTQPDTGGWAVTVGMPEGRALRRLCKEHGPWRTIPLTFNDPSEVAYAFDVADVALVVDGGRCEGEPPTLVDATVTPVRVLREGALPAQFVDAAMAMGNRKRWFSRARPKES
jgi:tRNA A37 threonylcarbamoyladenosine synthetase subunit TsaC/SUA5/YrdC